MARRLHVAAGTVAATLRRLGLWTPGSTEAQLGGLGEAAVIDGDGSNRESPGGQGAREEGLGTNPTKGAVAEAAAEEVASTEAAVETSCPRQGEPPSEPPPSEPALEPVPEPPAAMPWTSDREPLQRDGDRQLARLGLLDDAAPLFAPGTSVPQAGVLLALPVLVRSGLVETGQQVFQSIGPAFYGLRTMLVAFVVYALLRIKRAEQLKEQLPQDLGRILGLDRAPEVKTLRRKLRKLAEDERAETFILRLRERRVQASEEALGFLYVDGHVRVYHGTAPLPKTHSCRLRLSLPATQDVWVNDAHANPVLVVTQTAHPQLVSALPGVLAQVRPLVGKRRVTVVFDRGGWSPKLFAQMDRDGFDVLTYQKGEHTPIPADQFRSYTVWSEDGPITYELCERRICLLKGTFPMRQVIRRQGDHQTVVVTTRMDLPIEEVARRMFARWLQENFFKYMRQEFALDALVEYGTEAADPARLVPNPARKALDRQLAEAKKEVLRLEATYGAAALDNPEQARPSMRGFKIANGTTVGIPLRTARQRLSHLRQQRASVPTRIPAGQLPTPLVKLPGRCKRFSDTLKMLAYQTETDLLRVVALLYPRSRDEGRRLLVAAFHSAADLAVTNDELHVTLAPQSSPHRTRVIADLCELLTDTQTCFPGTSLKMRFAIHSSPSLVSSHQGE